MELLLEFINAACQLLDIDFCLEVSQVSGEFSQNFLVGLSCLLALVNSHPMGYDCLAFRQNLGLLGLDYIFLPLEKVSTNSLRRSPSYLTNLAMTRQFLVISSLPSHMNC